MASWHDRLLSPVQTANNARWKARMAWQAFSRQFIHAPAWVAARNRRDLVMKLGPDSIFLEPTNACNLRCPMCPTGSGKAQRKRGIMDVALAAKIIGEIRHKPSLFGYWLAGEPLLHPQITELVRLAADAGLGPGIHTNGTQLDEDLSEALIRAGLKWVSFSFDGDNAADYERMRPPARYEDTIERIKTFLRVKQRIGEDAGPHVIIQTLIPFENETVHPYGVLLECSEEFRRRFDGLPVNQFNAILVHGWSGQMEDCLTAAPNRAGLGGRWVCNVPWKDMTIAWNGDVVTCCGDLDAVNVLGNVAQENLYDVWNGKGYQQFRRAMSGGEIEQWKLCGVCERIWAKPSRNDYDLRLEILRHKLRF